MRLLLFLVFSVNLFASNTLILAGFPSSSKGGGIVTGQVNQTLVASQPPVAVQFTISTSSDIASITLTIGRDAVGKQITCSPFSVSAGVGNITCIIYTNFTPLSNSTFGNGTIANISATLVAKPGASVPFSVNSTPVLSPIEVDPNANTIVVAVGPPVAIALLSPCDVDGDGLINTNDVTLVVKAVLGLSPNPDLFSLQSIQKIINAAQGQTCTLP